jgi:hypothetical protein
MKRAILAAAVVGLGAYSVMAASPKVEAALKAFKAVASDSGKLKTFCAMDSAMEAAAEKKDKAAATNAAATLKQLGADFETAWNAGEDLDEKSADGKAFYAGMADLIGKCAKK